MSVTVRVCVTGRSGRSTNTDTHTYTHTDVADGWLRDVLVWEWRWGYMQRKDL